MILLIILAAIASVVILYSAMVVGSRSDKRVKSTDERRPKDDQT